MLRLFQEINIFLFFIFLEIKLGFNKLKKFP